MTTGRNTPSIDPALNGTLAGTILFAFNKLMQDINGMLPAHVIAYDRDKNRVQVQLDIMIVGVGGDLNSRPQIASLPVLQLGGGDFFLSFPLKEGNRGWVIANDRDISLFLQSYRESPPNTDLIKNFSSGLFVPDIMTGYTINSEDNEHAVLSSKDGTVRIALWPAQVKITAPNVLIDGNLAVIGGISASGGISVSGGSGDTISITGNLQLTGSFTQTGDMLVDGNIGATGTITPGI